MPRFRTGTRVGQNVYDHDRPAFQAHSDHDAERYVALLNLGERVETVSLDDISNAFTRAAERRLGVERGEWVCFDGFDADELARVAIDLLHASRETPASSPESPSEPPPAPGRPEDGSGPRGPSITDLFRPEKLEHRWIEPRPHPDRIDP